MDVILNMKNVFMKAKDSNKKKSSCAMKKCVESVLNCEDLFEVDRMREEEVANIDRNHNTDVNKGIETTARRGEGRG